MPTTAEQQLALELINLARADPAGQYDLLAGSVTDSNILSAISYFGVDLAAFETQMAAYDPVAPLAWSDALAQSADTHNDLMIANDEQAHYLPGEPGLLDRMQAAGYDNIRQVSENIFGYSESVFYAHAGFVIDWGYDDEDISDNQLLSDWQDRGDGMQDPAGHRITILNEIYTEVGIAWTAESDASTDLGPYVTTQHFGTTWDPDVYLLGVVIDDADGDDFYDIGEGMGGVTITASGSAGDFTTTSWASGGYQIVLPDGVYTVTFSGGGLSGTITQTVTIAGDNVKLDGHADQAESETETETALDLTGDDGDNSLTGGAGDDTINAGRGNDTVDAGAGNDNIWGFGGDDTLLGGDGDDTLRGGRENDSILGGEGDDSIVGQRNLDTVSGGAGNDTIKGGGGSDLLMGDAGDDYIKGGTYHDTIMGGDGNDTLTGNRHNDVLDGGAGADELNGGGDNDTLTGGTGDDWMKGGAGEDVFVFETGHGSDTIDDFNAAEDVLQITTALANFQSAAQIVAGAQLAGAGVILDFGDGDSILLDGLSNTTGLEAALDLIGPSGIV